VGLAVGDVFVGPSAERRPRTDRRERADQPPRFLPAGVAIPRTVDQPTRLVDREALADGPTSELDHRFRHRFARRDHDARMCPRIVGRRQRSDRLASDGERALGIEIGVDRERRVASRFVLDRGVQPDEHPTLDRTTLLADPRRHPCSEVRRTHSPLARVGVVDADDRHASSEEPGGQPRSDSNLIYKSTVGLGTNRRQGGIYRRHNHYIRCATYVHPCHGPHWSAT